MKDTTPTVSQDGPQTTAASASTPNIGNGFCHEQPTNGTHEHTHTTKAPKMGSKDPEYDSNPMANGDEPDGGSRLGPDRKTASSSPYSTTSTSPTGGFDSDSGSSKKSIVILVNGTNQANNYRTGNQTSGSGGSGGGSHEIDSDSGIGSSKETGGTNGRSPDSGSDTLGDIIYNLRLHHEDRYSDNGEDDTYRRNTPTTTYYSNIKGTLPPTVYSNLPNPETFDGSPQIVGPPPGTLPSPYYGTTSTSSKINATHCSGDELDDLKRGYEKKLRDKDTIISDMRDDNRREMVKLRQRHEQERIELTAYGEEQKRLCTEVQTSTKEIKRELQDKKWNLEMIQTDIASNKDQANILQRRMDMVQKELNMALDDRDRLIKIKKDLENAIYDSASEVSEMKSSRQALQSAQTSLRNDFLNLQEDLITKDETITGLEERVVKLQIDMSRLSKDKEGLEFEGDEKDKLVAALKRQVENLNQKLREQELSLHSASHYKKQLADLENRAREMEDDFYMKENKFKEKTEELEYELEILQNNTRITTETTVQENTDLKRKNQQFEDKMEEAKKKSFQRELKMQEAEAQLKLAQRQCRKMEDKLESIEINYNALLKRTRSTNNYGRMSAVGQMPPSLGHASKSGYAVGREYYDVMSASAMVGDGYDGHASEYGWPRVNRPGSYGRRLGRSVTPDFENPDPYMYTYDTLQTDYGTDDPNPYMTPSSRLVAADGWTDESPPTHFRAPRSHGDVEFEEPMYPRPTPGAPNKRRNGAVETYLDEYGFERPTFNIKKKGASLASTSDQANNTCQSKTSMAQPNTLPSDDGKATGSQDNGELNDSHDHEIEY